MAMSESEFESNQNEEIHRLRAELAEANAAHKFASDEALKYYRETLTSNSAHDKDMNAWAELVAAAMKEHKEHLTSADCWCRPILDTPESEHSAAVYVHRDFGDCQHLLDRLARVEALIAKWRKVSEACLGDDHGECSCHAYDECANDLEQALKGEPHAK